MTKIFLRYAFNSSSWNPNKPEWLKAMSCIQTEERYRITSYAYQRDAKASLAGRLLARKVITDLLNLSNTVVRLERTEKGRPFLVPTDLPQMANILDFNLSHQGDFTVLTAGLGVKTGVDVMKVQLPGIVVSERSVESFFDLMKRQFSEKEWISINSPEQDIDKMRLFYRHWCLKESYVKALGIGIGIDLEQFVCTTSNNCEPWVSWIDQDKSLWKFEEHALDEDHVVAIAWHGSNVQQDVKFGSFIHLTFADILASMETLHRAESEFWINFKSKQPLPPYLMKQ